MSDESVTVELTILEARALRGMGKFMIAKLLEQGCDLNNAELPDGSEGPAALLTACMRLELALAMQGAEL